MVLNQLNLFFLFQSIVLFVVIHSGTPSSDNSTISKASSNFFSKEFSDNSLLILINLSIVEIYNLNLVKIFILFNL